LGDFLGGLVGSLSVLLVLPVKMGGDGLKVTVGAAQEGKFQGSVFIVL
jgi:hypothetical protein